MIPADLRQRFDAPGDEFGPMPCWWWSGDEVTIERVQWQLRQFHRGGIRQVVVINLAPSGPNHGAPADDPLWFSERWWECFERCCDLAQQLGMRLWFYDQIGFSGANLQGAVRASHPEVAGRRLESEVIIVGDEPPGPSDQLIGAYLLDGDDWTLVPHLSELRRGQRVRLVSWHETAFDYLNPAAFALLMDRVHGEMERRLPHYLGNVIAGSFQDEMAAAPTWSIDFPQRFLERFGYPLVTELAGLWGEATERAAAIRVDVATLRAELFEAAVFRPLGEWHAARGMLIGCDQMNPARSGHPIQGSQLYGDYLATHRWYNAAGCDHEGDGRIHSSLADLYDHPRVFLEAFHSSGWGGTLEDTWDWLIPFFTTGANLFSPHASYYSTHAGWFEWAPPSTDFRQPYFAAYPQFADAVARVCSVLTWGRHEVTVGLLHPTTTVQALVPLDAPHRHFGLTDLGPPHADADETQQVYLDTAGVSSWFEHRASVLDRTSTSFDILDDHSVARATVEPGRMTINGLHFSTIILPCTDYLLSTTAERVGEFVAAGGRLIVVGRRPRLIVGDGRCEPVGGLFDGPNVVTLTAPEDLAEVFTENRCSGLPRYVRTDGSGSGAAFLPAAYPNASAHPLQEPGTRHRWTDYDFDPARYQSSTTMVLDTIPGEVEVWNPATGARWPAVVTPNGTRAVVEIDFRGAPAVIAVWGADRSPQRSPEPSTPAPPRAPLREVDLNQGWSGDLVPTLDNRWADFALPRSADPLPLQIRRLDWHTGGNTVEVKVGYGQEVLVAGPFPAETAPPPLTPDEAMAVVAGQCGLPDGGGWSVHRYSPSRGIDGDPAGKLGPKGMVPEEFIRQPVAAAGEEVAVRAVICVPEPGDYVLKIGASATKQAWLNGRPVGEEPESYDLTAPVSIPGTVAVLEYRLGPDHHVYNPIHGGLTPTIASYFTLHRPGEAVSRPEFIRAVTPGPVGDVRYRTTVDVDGEVRRARCIIGSGVSVTVAVDGVAAARQERVEIYQVASGRQPGFLCQDLAELSPGHHDIALIAHHSDGRDPVYFDLLIEYADGRRHTVNTSSDWTSDHGAVAAALELGRNLHSAHVAQRPHPLPDAHWLTGPPDVGALAVRVLAATTMAAEPQVFTLTLPAGTISASIPASVRSTALAGRPVEVRDRVLTLESAPDGPVELQIVTEPAPFSRGGAAWDDQITVTTRRAPISLGSWSELGLGAWSGGVCYERLIDLADAGRTELDLGRVRGAVVVEIDGRPAGTLFCAPFVVDLGMLVPGRHRLTATVYNTLAPRFHSFSPTKWATYPSQLESGIFGPVRLRQY